MWVEVTEKEIIFIAETGVSYKLGTTNLCSIQLVYSKLNNNYNRTPIVTIASQDVPYKKAKEREEVKEKERDEKAKV